MAPHSSTLAWRIPWTEEPARLQSTGSLRVRHDWVTSLSLFTFMHWRRKWQPTPVFLPGESQGQGGEPGGLPPMGSHRVGHDWSDLAAAARITAYSSAIYILVDNFSMIFSAVFENIKFLYLWFCFWTFCDRSWIYLAVLVLSAINHYSLIPRCVLQNAVAASGPLLFL